MFKLNRSNNCCSYIVFERLEKLFLNGVITKISYVFKMVNEGTSVHLIVIIFIFVHVHSIISLIKNKCMKEFTRCIIFESSL